MSHIPSLSNPPAAPKKSARAKPRDLSRIRHLNLVEEEEQVSWRWLAERGVRPKFLRYNPDDVKEIDDMETLWGIRNFYLPSSQPQNIYEHSYCEMMVSLLDEKMYNL